MLGSCDLIGLLVAISAVTLLFTTRYPKSLYDFLLGMNGWVFRIAAYSSLETDVHPPFHLDMGGTKPASDAIGRASPTPAVAFGWLTAPFLSFGLGGVDG